MYYDIKEKETPRRKKMRITSFADLEQYLKTNHEFSFSDVERKDLKRRISSATIIPSDCAIDALFEEWQIWEPYVAKNPEELNKFIVDGIKSLIKIKVTGTSNDIELLESFIGNKCTVVKPLPIDPIYTTVSLNGVLKRDGLQIKKKSRG